MPLECTVLEGNNESSDEYCEETDTHHPLAELLEQFQQLKDQFASLKSTTYQSTSTVELMQFADRLQHLTMIQQLHSSPQPSEEPVHKTMQLSWMLCTQHRENQTPP